MNQEKVGDEIPSHSEIYDEQSKSALIEKQKNIHKHVDSVILRFLADSEEYLRRDN